MGGTQRATGATIVHGNLQETRDKEEGTKRKEEGTRDKEEGRRNKEEGRRDKEEEEKRKESSPILVLSYNSKRRSHSVYKDFYIDYIRRSHSVYKDFVPVSWVYESNPIHFIV